MSPKLKLRRFLYLDGDLTDEFLAQVEGGLFEEESQSASGRSERGIKGEIKAGLDDIKELAGEPITAPAAVVTPIAIFR